MVSTSTRRLPAMTHVPPVLSTQQIAERNSKVLAPQQARVMQVTKVALQILVAQLAVWENIRSRLAMMKHALIV